MKLSAGKRKHLKALSDGRGVIAAVAMDQRGSLQTAIAAAQGIEKTAVSPQMMAEFKVEVSRALTPLASAILLDPEFGLDAAQARHPGCGLLLAYELSGYDNTRPGRLPDLLENVSVKRIVDWGANAVKILIYYTPDEDPKINDVKHAFIERVGAECETYEIPFFLEFIGYNPAGGGAQGLEFARLKPRIVMESMAEFSKPQYRVDVLKVEVPVNPVYTEGSRVFRGERAYSYKEALGWFKKASDAAVKPFIYLSAGVDNDVFTEQLRMAGEAGSGFSGVLCGRATWKEGIPEYGKGGREALARWLADQGVKNIRNVNEALKPAKPWWAKLGLDAAAVGA